MKGCIGQLCFIGGTVLGIFIGTKIASDMDGWAAGICVFVFLIAGMGLGAWIGISIEDSLARDTNKPFYEQTTNSNNSEPQTIFRKIIENEFEHSIRETMNYNSMDKDITDSSPVMGMLVYSTIAHTCKALKDTDFRATGISKQKVDEIIDEITKNMLHKYL